MAEEKKKKKRTGRPKNTKNNTTESANIIETIMGPRMEVIKEVSNMIQEETQNVNIKMQDDDDQNIITSEDTQRLRAHIRDTLNIIETMLDQLKDKGYLTHEEQDTIIDHFGNMLLNLSKKFDLELKLLDHKVAKNEQTIANLIESTIKNTLSSNETPVIGKQMENGIKMLNEKVNNQDNLNREGFSNMDTRIKDLEIISYNYSVKDGTLLDLVDNKKIEERFIDERNFVVEELRKIGQMMHFHDILWRFMLAFYNGYSKDHNAEGPSFCNKNGQEQMIQHALENIWRAPKKETSKFFCFPALPINQGFE